MIAILLKSAIIVLMMTMAVLMDRLVMSGRANTRLWADEMVDQHKIFARTLLGFTVLTVILIETKVRMDGGIRATDILFVVHLVFASSFLADLLALNFWIHGRKSMFHALAAYLLVVLFIGMILTGIPLVLRM